jgi:hypothetical protein
MVRFEPTETPIEISKFMKTLRPSVPSRPLLSPLLAVDMAVGPQAHAFANTRSCRDCLDTPPTHQSEHLGPKAVIQNCMSRATKVHANHAAGNSTTRQ